VTVTTATAAWVGELQDALGADGVLLDPDVPRAIKDALDPAGLLIPGKVFRRPVARDLAAVTALTAP
jgi:FAD/FMN-containing dehydrogenase